jgi:hypothetical protein
MYLDFKKVSPLACSLAEGESGPGGRRASSERFQLHGSEIATKFNWDVYKTLRIALSYPSVYKEGPEERYFDARGDSEN